MMFGMQSKGVTMDGAGFCWIGNKKSFNIRRLNRMKKCNHVVLILILVLALAGCGGGNGGGGNPSGGGGGYTGVAFAMVPVPAVTNFPTGTDDTGTGSVTNPYYIAQTEVTYELWKAVYDWATDSARANQYYFQNAGSEGSMGTVGAAPTANNQHPVTTVSWRDAMVWCNALTEYYAAKGGTSLACVYTYNGATVRDSRDSNGTACDSVAANITAKGFRLPTNDEWELAARYKDGTNWTPGSYASGAIADYNNTTATAAVAVYNASSTAEVKSKAANALNLYDMSGNVYQWCFEWYPDESVLRRVCRGGSWANIGSDYIQLGNVACEEYHNQIVGYMGFRPVRTQ
jgi:sulfatase modifying factor 1